ATGAVGLHRPAPFTAQRPALGAVHARKPATPQPPPARHAGGPCVASHSPACPSPFACLRSLRSQIGPPRRAVLPPPEAGGEASTMRRRRRRRRRVRFGFARLSRPLITSRRRIAQRVPSFCCCCCNRLGRRAE